MTDSKLATVLMILARALKEAAEVIDDKRTVPADGGTKAQDKPAAAEKSKQTRKAAAPKVKKEEVIKAFQELAKLPGGRAKIDDVLDDHLPKETALKAGNLKAAQYTSVLEATKAVIEEVKANPDTDDDEGFE